MQPFIEYIVGEWEMISQAPVSFMLAAGLAGFVIWLFRRTFYTSQISTLNARIQLRDDQINDFQRKLNAETPADALVKLGELTERVDSLSLGRWDRLTKDQITQICQTIKAFPPGVVEIEMTDDARGLGYPLAEMFKQLGWNVVGTKMIGADDGIRIRPRSILTRAVADALMSAARIPVTFEGDERESGDFSVELGGKPIGSLLD